MNSHNGNRRKILAFKCRSRNSNLPKRQRTLPPLPHDFNIDDIKKHRCYRTWLTLADGDLLKRYSTTFKKGDDHSEQRLIRRIHTQIRATQTQVSGKDIKKNNVMIFKCTELPDSDDSTPVSPPNQIQGKKYEPSQIISSRNDYRSFLMNVKNGRKYVKAALYSELMFDVTHVYDVRKFQSPFDFEISTPYNTNTIMKVRDLSQHTELLSSVLTLNKSIPKSQQSKSDDTGDDGITHKFGMKQRCLYDYPCMNQSPKRQYMDNFQSFVEVSEPILTSTFPQEMYEIHNSLGGQSAGINNICTFVSITKNLRSSSHYECDDNSKSIVIFSEKFPGESKGWYFLFPNLVRNNKKENAIAIKLFHGCAISFDASLLRHCTVFSGPGKMGNETYGNLFVSKKF